MRTNGILVLLWASLSTVTLAGPDARSNREPDITKLPIRYDGYKYGYSPVGSAVSIKSWDEEYPSRYGGVHGSLRNDKHVEEQRVGKPRYERGYDLEHLEEELTKAFLDRRGKHGVGYGSEHRSRGEHLGSSGDHGVGKEPESGHGSGSEHHGMSGNHASGQVSMGGHMETLGGQSSGGGHLKNIGGHSNAGGHTESSGEHSSGIEHSGISGSHGSGSGQMESGVGHQEMMHVTKTGVEHHEKQNHELSKVEEHHGSEPSRFKGRYRDRHEDHYKGRYGGRYGDTSEHHLLRDRLPYGDAHKALVGGFINAGRHKDYKGSYEGHKETYDHKGLEKGLGFFAQKDTSDEHLQLKSYYIKGDSPESYEYHPYSSYRPHGYHRRYEHSSEESKEFYGYKGLYFGSNERTGFIRDFIKSKGSEEKSKYKGSHEKSKSKSFFGKSKSKGSEEKSKSKSIGKAAGLTKEYYSFIKDIMKDLDKGLSIKADDKGDKGKGEKGKGEKGEEKGKGKGKGNNNGLFGGDLVNVIKVTFGHEEKKSEIKGARRRRSITGYAGKFIDPSVI